MASNPLATSGLVLRKTPFSETSLVFACLTPDLGQLHLLARGALKPGRNKFPAIDLFRQVRLSCVPTRGELYAVREVECERDFAGVASSPSAYRAAGWLCRFVLQNTVTEQPAPQLFAALAAAFARLADRTLAAPPRAVVLGVCFVALHEHGVLPELAADDPRCREMAHTIAAATDETLALPDYAEAVWNDLGQWMCGFLNHVGLTVPKGWDAIMR